MNRILVLAEHANGRMRPATAAAAAGARQLCANTGGAFDVLVLGAGVESVVASCATLGAARVLVADDPVLRRPLADNYAAVIAQVARETGATFVVAAASTFSKDCLPRAAALLDAGMLSDVIGIRSENGDFLFRRPCFAGNLVATVRLAGAVRCLTVRSSAFPAPKAESVSSPVVPVVPGSLPALIEFVSREERQGARPDAGEARIVVSGGRALANAADFERLVGGLADALGAAVGSSRALVDAGITANSLQIGQTGKIVAPELYIAVGISGAIQHLAGMKDSRVVVAINRDAEAPIFEMADYGLVADVYAAVPELIARLKV